MEELIKLTERKNFLLAIGIDIYAKSRFNLLHNAVYDVKKITEILCEKYNFELVEQPILNENATKQKIIDSLNELVATLTPEDNIVIYFAGHGIQNPITNHGYWIPYDVNDSPSSYIPNSTIKDAIEGIDAKHVFLISDSCYSGTFLTRTRSADIAFYYDKLDALKSRWVLASGGEEKVSDGSEEGTGSPFFNVLYDFLNENTNKHLSVSEIINHVNHATRRIAKQQPNGAYIQNVGHEDGQMVLVLKDDYSKNNNTSFILEKKPEIEENSTQFSTGKELLIIKSFIPTADYLIVELFRFDDDGNKKNIFRDNIVRPRDGKNGKEDEWELVQRFATMTGVIRYLDENKDFTTKNRVIVMYASEEIDQIESTAHAKQHYKKLQQLKVANTTLMTCLHCSKSILSNDNLFIEIDEEGLKPAMGNIHKECVRPADRILGKLVYPDLTENSSLVNFDYQEWINLLKRGQGFITATKKIEHKDVIPIIGWNPDHKFNSGNYCIRLTAEDGESSYAHLGKDIQRYKESEIDAEVDLFKSMLLKSETSGDPMGVTSEKRIFGNYTQLEIIKNADEKILKIVGVEKSKYSNQFSQINVNIDNDYAPLCLVIDPISENIINQGNCIPIISDPFKFDDFHKNWNAAGYTIDKCELRIIKSDSELDHYLRAFLEDGMQPILDPMFDKEAELIKGYYISDFKDLLEKRKNERTYIIKEKKGGFKEGQIVEVIFPGKKMDKFPTGILACDEFEDETGEMCSIFIPIEDGKKLELSYKMPVKLFRLKNG